MELELRAQQVDLVEALRANVQRRLRFKLGRHADRIRRLTLRLSEQTGAKGGAAKQCVLAADLVPSGEVIVTETHADLYSAISGAVENLRSVLRRKLDRQRERWRGRESIRVRKEIKSTPRAD